MFLEFSVNEDFNCENYSTDFYSSYWPNGNLVFLGQILEMKLHLFQIKFQIGSIHFFATTSHFH